MTTFGDVMHLADELDSGSVLSERDLEDYINTIMDALAIHIQKEGVRHALWKEYPTKDQANQIKIKIDRIIRSLETGLSPDQRDNAVEELLDIINYANFSVRILRGQVP